MVDFRVDCDTVSAYDANVVELPNPDPPTLFVSAGIDADLVH